MNIYKDYKEPLYMGGEPWIDFNIKISKTYSHDLVDHILEFGKTNKYLSGIIYNGGRTFTLPKSSEFNEKDRIIELTEKDDHLIVGINTKDKSPLSINEVEAFKTCFESYNTIYEEKQKTLAAYMKADYAEDYNGYNKKYLKYKMKYLNLKNSLKNNF